MKAPSKKRHAVIYARVSTVKQGETHSIATQVDECRKLAERQGLQVSEDAVFTEMFSAKEAENRPQFQVALNYCLKHSGEVAVLLVHHTSRFARNTEDHLAVRSLLKRKGVMLRSCTESLGESPAEEFMETLLAANNKLDNRIKGDRTRAGMTAAANHGRWPFQPPVGYRTVTGAMKMSANIEPDPEKAELVKRAFELVASGTPRHAALKIVTELGLRSTKGQPLTNQSFVNMLTNPLYTGMVVIPQFGVRSKGLFGGLVSEALFKKVQAIIKPKGPVVMKSEVNDDFPLRGWVRCAHCGTKLTGSMSTGRHGGRYGYYHCWKKGCLAKRVSRDNLHSQVLELLRRLKPDPGQWEVFKTVLIERWQHQRATITERRQILQAQLKEMDSRKLRLVDLVVTNVMSEDLFKEQLTRLESSISDVSNQIEDIAAEVEDEEFELYLLLGYAERVLNAANSLWEQGKTETRLSGVNYFFGLTTTISPDQRQLLCSS